MLKIEEGIIQKLYKNKKRNTTVCPENKLLTTTTQQYKLDSIVSYIKKLSKISNDTVYYVEIGVKYGGVLAHVLENTKNIDIEVIGIDLFEDFIPVDTNTHSGDIGNRDKMLDKFRDLGYNNVELFKGDSSKILDIILPMDNVVCFIDGNHTYAGVKKDYEGIVKKMKKGYIIFDDIDPLWVGVRKFYNELPGNIKVETNHNYGVAKKNI